MALNKVGSLIVLFSFLLINVQCNGVSYTLINRNGQDSSQLATELYNRLIKVDSPSAIGPIIASEIASNDFRCQLAPQITFVCQHLRESGHLDNMYAKKSRRGNKAPDSIYNITNAAVLNVVALDTIISDLLNLLLSGRVSFSIGGLQSTIPPRDERGFILFANISGHGITNLGGIPGNHQTSGNTDYIRIVFRFMDRIRAELDTLGVPDQQLNIVTMYPENPTSNDLQNSILPNGVDPATNTALGSACNGNIPPVLPLLVNPPLPVNPPPANPSHHP